MDFPWNNPPIWHAINVHLPITLAMLGLPMLCVVAITRGKHRALRWSTFALYAVVALAAWFAAITGEGARHALSPNISAAASERVEFHEWMAQWVWVLAAITAVLLLCANFPRRWARQAFTTFALIFSVTTAIWVMVTAHSGGLAVYDHGLGTVAMRDGSPDHSKSPAVAQAPSPTRERGDNVATTQALTTTTTTTTAPVAAAVAPQTAQLVSFTRQIQPLLQQRCSECHSADKEIKGGFDIATLATITKGGKKAGAGIVPGKPDDSSIVQYIEGKKQPRMPKGKTMPDAEIALVRAWVAAGAVDDANMKVAAATPAPTAPGVSTLAPTAELKAAPAPAPATQASVTEDWDPQVTFNPADSVAVRRFVRLKNLPAAPEPPKVNETPLVYNVIDQFVISKWSPDAKAQALAATQPTSQPTTSVASTESASTAPTTIASTAPATVASTAPATIAATAPATVASTAPTTAAAVAAAKPVDGGLADDATFVRRVYLDVLGMIPTADEARKFVEDKDDKKRTKLIDALLDRSKEYAGNWVPFWEDALCSNGQHQGGVGTHGNYRQWLFDTFYDNKPYDVMVQELLDPTMPSHPARYVLNDNHERTLQSASNTAQVFLGTAIKCASCHSHFLNDEWPQARAVAYSGFFASKDLELVRCERSSGQFVQTHFMFNLPKAPTSAPADQNERLKRVAQLITDPSNPRFAKTMVNRLWKRYMGLGLFEPADDYREDTPPSHPELLNWLADDFIRHGYDVKRTIKLILNSRTYQLKYDPTVEDHFNVEKPKDPRYFRSPSLRRLTAEEIFDSISVAMAQRVPEKRAYQDDKSTPLTRSLGKPAARNEVSTQRPDDTAVVQALELLNGEEWHDRIYKGELVTNSAVQPKLDQLVEDLYWSAYSRGPSSKEKDAALAYLKSAPPAPATTQPVEIVLLDDEVPTRATKTGAWKFVTEPDFPVFSGKTSHTEAEQGFPGNVQHVITGTKFPVTPKDKLFNYVWIDPKEPPKELMIQFLVNGEWRRASWGENVMPPAFNPKTNFGPMPKGGEWVRLEFPAIKIGIDKPGVIAGISYDQFVGKAVFWDKTGAIKGPPLHDPETIGDMLWALITSPEFQYVK